MTALRYTTTSLLLAAALLAAAAPAFGTETPVAEFSQLQMYSSFWQNLHHFLYVSAWAKRPVVPSQPRLGMPLPEAEAVSMTPDEKKAWDAAVAYYDRKFASLDLLLDTGMTAIKLALADADDTLSNARIDAELRATLQSAAPIYRKYWWRDHDAANRAWIEAAARRTAPVAPAIIAKLTALYGVEWFKTPVRVDVVRYGKNLGAYTSNNPRAHIVVASADDSYGDWASTEMLFHESSRLVFQSLRCHEQRVTRGEEEPRERFMARGAVLYRGEVTRQRLAMDGVDYRPYLYATGLFDRAWLRFRTPIETHVQPFIDGRTTLEQMAKDLAEAVP